MLMILQPAKAKKEKNPDDPAAASEEKEEGEEDEETDKPEEEEEEVPQETLKYARGRNSGYHICVRVCVTQQYKQLMCTNAEYSSEIQYILIFLGTLCQVCD